MNFERICIAAFWTFALALTVAFWVAVGAFLGATWGMAHDAIASRQQPYGWKYDTSCCNTTDCRQLGYDEVEETETGYVWKSKHSGAVHVFEKGETLGDSTPRIRRSQDEFFHGCETNQTIGANGTVIVPSRKLCFYAPDKGI